LKAGNTLKFRSLTKDLEPKDPNGLNHAVICCHLTADAGSLPYPIPYPYSTPIPKAISKNSQPVLKKLVR
jgi:hypothetical protein